MCFSVRDVQILQDQSQLLTAHIHNLFEILKIMLIRTSFGNTASKNVNSSLGFIESKKHAKIRNWSSQTQIQPK